MNDLENILISFSAVIDDNLILYGDDKFDDTKNRKILLSTLRVIEDSQRFDEQLFLSSASVLHLYCHNCLLFY